MSDLNEEDGHPQRVKPSKSASREGDGFINSSEQMKAALDPGLSKSSLYPATKAPLAANAAKFSTIQDENLHCEDDYYESSHLETDYIQPSASSSRPYSQPFPSHYSQPAASYSQTSNLSRGVYSARSGDPYFSLGAYDQPSARGLSGQGG